MSKIGLHVGNNPDGSKIEVPFEVMASEKTRGLQKELADFVDSKLSPADREGMSAMLQAVTLSIVTGNPPPDEDQGWALVALMGALQWAQGALALGGQIALQCEACTTLDELDLVTLDLSVLGPPPSITAGQIAAALMP